MKRKPHEISETYEIRERKENGVLLLVAVGSDCTTEIDMLIVLVHDVI